MPTNTNSYQYYYPPNNNQPYSQPILLDPRFDLIIQHLSQLEQHQLNKKEQVALAEEAYSEITENAHQLWVADKRGIMHVLLEINFDHVYYVTHDFMYNRGAFYAIAIHNVPGYLVISEKDFYRPSQLLNAIAKASGKKLRLYKSERQTSELLRQHVSSIATELHIPFYLGWQPVGDSWKFEIVNSSTHGMLSHNPAIPSEYSKPSTEISPSATLLATEQFILLMETIVNPDIRCTICLWFHASVLSSLLASKGYRIPLGLCLYTSDSKVRRHLEATFSWFGDLPITLATPTKRFICRIAERKDQPLLVRDSTGHKENAEILLHSMESGEIPLEVSKEVSCPALHSLPTVISECVSILSSSPHFATIDVDRRDLAPCTEETLTALNRYITDYLRCFTEYVSTHIDELTMYVSCGIDDVTSDEIGEYEGLSEDGITTYGILLGIQQMISGFYHSLAPNKELEVRMHNLLFPSHFSIFRTALLNAADSNCNVDDLASLFLSITNHMIDQNQFDARSIHDAKIDVPCNESKLGIVYADEFSICLTRHAFKAICTACDVSGPMMLKALSDAELLKGTRVNSETMQTRITVYDACGKAKVARVYKFEREAIESNYT